MPPLSPRNPRSLEGSLARVHSFGRIVKIRINEILTTSMYELSFTFNSGTKFGCSMSTVEADEKKSIRGRLHAAESTAKSDEKAPP